MAATIGRCMLKWRRTISSSSLDSLSPLAYEFHTPSGSTSNCNPVLILHGLFGSKKNNRAISKVLARDLKRPIYAIDLRNHGDSPHHLQHDYISMAEDLAGFISAHNLEKLTLIGHSMGAKAAMVLALLHPSLVQNIVSVDNAPVCNMFQSDFAKYIKGMKVIEKECLEKQSEADEILQNYVESLSVRQFLLGNLYRTEQKVLRFKIPLDTLNLSLVNLRNFPIQDSKKYTFYKPALFLRGVKSRYVTDDMLPDIRKFFPQYKLVDIEAGHWLISENPEEFRKAVVNFLDTTEI